MSWTTILDHDRGARSWTYMLSRGCRSIGCIGVLFYVAEDRGYLAHGLRLLAQDSIKPREDSWQRLKCVVRYAHGTRDLETYFPCALQEEDLKIYTDAEWAGDRKRGDSVSYAVMKVAGCVLPTNINAAQNSYTRYNHRPNHNVMTYPIVKMHPDTSA